MKPASMEVNGSEALSNAVAKISASWSKRTTKTNKVAAQFVSGAYKLNLKFLYDVPSALLTVHPTQIRKALPEPTLIKLAGKREPPLFVSILLHGNETTSLFALQRLLRKYRFGLPRSLLIFVGNVWAAEAGLRHLEGQPDFNRIWDGGKLLEQQMASQVLRVVKKASPFAAIDVHNTSGRNPHYVCTTELRSDWLRLGAAFSSTIVYFAQPREVQSRALSQICPAVTVECGLSSETAGVQHVFEYLDTCLHLKNLCDLKVHDRDLNLYHSFARVKVPSGSKVVFFDSPDFDFRFSPEFDLLNFSELKRGDLFGLRSSSKARLHITDEMGRCVTDDFVEYRGLEMRLKRDVVPSMLSCDPRIIHQDCLGYLMVPIDADHLLEKRA